MPKALTPYQSLLNEIVKEIEQHRIKAALELNTTQMHLYFTIGGSIVQKQEAEGWGKSVVQQLASDLKKLTGSGKGFSTQNLWFMRQFFIEYQSNETLQQLAFQIPWGQNILILTKIKDEQHRHYYLSKTIEAAWSRNTLLNQIKAEAHTRQSLLPKQHNFKNTLPSHLTEQAMEILKSDYNLEFLGIAQPLLERQLENRLVENIKDFILELGYGFSYIGNQYRLSLNDKEYFVDLLFFQRKLKCLVAIDLKIGSFEPEFAGKMNFYLNLLNKQVKLPDENPSIGIILCAEKNLIEVEYALSGMSNPIGVAEYTYRKQLPANLKGELPGASELKKKLQEEISKNKKK